ncbi:HIT family protein [Streptomyces sp. NPDC007063]|uniref:HIT family protein n=1 Tax=Streptomyces sp. NPDC007063 TaxID=3364772 RepID=UPI00367B0472
MQTDLALGAAIRPSPTEGCAACETQAFELCAACRRCRCHRHDGCERDLNCVFCRIASQEAPATVVRDWGDVLAIRPRGGVHPGHTLVMPCTHVSDAGTRPEVTARTMECAAALAAQLPAANIITSKGAAATQTVWHLHLHVVPRADGDGLPLPWTPQQTTEGTR